MNPTTRLIRSLFPTLLAATLAAQQQVCLGVHGGAAGVNQFGAASRLSARIGGTTVTIFPAAGQVAPACSFAHQAAFTAMGYTTVRLDPETFRVTSGPGGITDGAVYGTDDSSLDLQSSVQESPLPFVDPRTKASGAMVPLPQPNQPPQPFGGNLTVCIDARVGGAIVTTCRQLQLQPGFPAGPLANDIQLQLEIQGFFGNRVFVEDPLVPGSLIEVLQLERTNPGEPIVGVRILFDANSRRLVPTVTGAGVAPFYGADEYGRATQGAAFGEPWSMVLGVPRVGTNFNVIHEMRRPNAFAIEVLSLAPSALPVFGGFLLVDPATMVLELGVTDGTGRMQRPWWIPANPMLGGFQLCSQGVVLIPGAQDVFSTGVRCVLRP
ncbi:MAG TPA: hypothetical protein VFZ65_16890 [Planctomycetota bacterium]|nr:hypothetical protein [Planctomycetota bacterium]